MNAQSVIHIKHFVGQKLYRGRRPFWSRISARLQSPPTHPTPTRRCYSALRRGRNDKQWLPRSIAPQRSMLSMWSSLRWRCLTQAGGIADSGRCVSTADKTLVANGVRPPPLKPNIGNQVAELKHLGCVVDVRDLADDALVPAGHVSINQRYCVLAYSTVRKTAGNRCLGPALRAKMLSMWLRLT